MANMPKAIDKKIRLGAAELVSRGATQGKAGASCRLRRPAVSRSSAALPISVSRMPRPVGQAEWRAGSWPGLRSGRSHHCSRPLTGVRARLARSGSTRPQHSPTAPVDLVERHPKPISLTRTRLIPSVADRDTAPDSAGTFAQRGQPLATPASLRSSCSKGSWGAFVSRSASRGVRRPSEACGRRNHRRTVEPSLSRLRSSTTCWTICRCHCSCTQPLARGPSSSSIRWSSGVASPCNSRLAAPTAAVL